MNLSYIIAISFFSALFALTVSQFNTTHIVSERLSTGIVREGVEISLKDVQNDCQEIEKILSGRDWLTNSFKIGSMSKSGVADSVSYFVQFYLPIYSSLRGDSGHYRINGHDASGIIANDPLPYEDSLIAFDRKFLPQENTYRKFYAFDKNESPPKPIISLHYNDISKGYHEFDRDIDADWGTVTIEDNYTIASETYAVDYFKGLGLRFTIFTKYWSSPTVNNDSKLPLSLNGHKVYLTIDAYSTDDQFEIFESVEDDLRLVFSGAISYGLDRKSQFVVESISLINIVSNELLFSYGIGGDD